MDALIIMLGLEAFRWFWEGGVKAYVTVQKDILGRHTEFIIMSLGISSTPHSILVDTQSYHNSRKSPMLHPVLEAR
jgi:hypothetical protein